MNIPPGLIDVVERNAILGGSVLLGGSLGFVVGLTRVGSGDAASKFKTIVYSTIIGIVIALAGAITVLLIKEFISKRRDVQQQQQQQPYSYYPQQLQQQQQQPPYNYYPQQQQQQQPYYSGAPPQQGLLSTLFGNRNATPQVPTQAATQVASGAAKELESVAEDASDLAVL